MPPPRLQVVRNDSEAGSPCASIDVTIESIDRLFHVLDPSPGVERDLDELVESYVLASARELPGTSCFAMNARMVSGLARIG